jgi:cell wall assembly regulator SMI1
LEFVVFANGKYEVERTFYDFDNQIPFTSTPGNAIRKKYFHYKWLPLFSDYSGNYLGIDCDPDINGKKGQIINFGRDEEDMVVLADSLEHFFDFILSEIKTADSSLLHTEYHLHDTLKKLKKLRHPTK